MRPFASHGQFWLPGKPDRRVPGELIFDSAGLRLTVFGLLEDPLSEGQVMRGAHRATYDSVHGQFFDGRRVTVEGLARYVDRHPGSTKPEVYNAETALLDGHATTDAFTAVQVGFDVLTGWADPEPIADTAADGRRVLNHEPQTLVDVQWREWTVRIRAFAVGHHGPDVHLDQQTRLEIEGPATGLRDLLEHWLQPLQDLLIVMIGEPVVITDISVRPERTGPRDPMLKVHFHTSQPEPSQRVGSARFRNWDSRTLVVREDDAVDFAGLLVGWLDMVAETDGLDYVIQLLNAPMNAPFMFVDNRFTFAFQAVEQIAKLRFGGQERPKVEHDARVKAVVDALTTAKFSDEDRSWVQNRLQSSNSKKLTTLLEELLASMGTAGAALLEADAARVFAALRSKASHGARARLSAEQKYWLERALSWIARIDLLHAAGAPLDPLLERAMQKPEFLHAIQVVAAL